MELVCPSGCFNHGDEDIIDATLATARPLGYRLLELNGPYTCSREVFERMDVPALKRRIAAGGMQCAGIYTAGWGGGDAAKVRQNVAEIVAAVRVVEGLGGSYITTSGDGRQGDEGGLGRVIDCVRLILEQIPPTSQVHLGLEPHWPDNILLYEEDFAEVMEAVPDERAGVCVDLCHFHWAGVDTAGLIRRFGCRIHNVHFKDATGPEQHEVTGMGRGEIDLGAVIGALQEVGYEGYLNLELEVKDRESIPRYLAEAYVYIKGLLNEKLETAVAAAGWGQGG